MSNRISKLFCALLLFVLAVSMLFLTGCNPDGQMSPEEYESYINGYSKHRFNFNTPEGWDSLSVDEQVEWGKENGFLIIQHFDGDTELDNYHLLDEFLENKDEEKELLILVRYYFEDYYVNWGKKDSTSLLGIYYDGESYYALPPYEFDSSDQYFLQKYKKCGIETDADSGRRYLYVANDFTLTQRDEVQNYVSSIAFDNDFYKKYKSVVWIDTVPEG